MTKTSSIQNYWKAIAKNSGAIPDKDGRTWCF